MAVDETRAHLFFSRPLPLQLLFPIASHLSNTSQPVSQTTLAHIARCSKDAYLLAQPLLYSTFHLDDDRSTYLFDNFIDLYKMYDGGSTFPPFLFDTFSDLHPIDMPSYLRILHNLWNVKTLVIKTTPYGTGMGLFREFAQKLKDDGVVMLPKLKRVVIARSALERVARAEKVHKRIASPLFLALESAAEPTHICVEIPPEPPIEFRMKDADESSSRRRNVFVRGDQTFESYFTSLIPQKTREIVTHVNGAGVKAVSIRGVRNVVSFAEDMPNLTGFMAEDEDEDLRDFLPQPAIANTIDLIVHAISNAVNVRPSRRLDHVWIPSMPTAPPPEDNTPLSPAAQAQFWQQNPGAFDSEGDPARTDSASTTSGRYLRVPVLPLGTVDSPHGFSASTDSSRVENGTTFRFILPGWMVLEPLEMAVRDWVMETNGGRYADRNEALQESIQFESHGAGLGSECCGACGRRYERPVDR